MSVAGFTDADFDLFDIPTFDERMAALKTRVTPKLKELGASLAEPLTEEVGAPVYPHVAQHLRRSVNPPEETWVAFSRDRRGYKPYVHLRVAINGLGVKVACFMEEYSEDKPTMSANLAANAARLAEYLDRHPRIRSHDHEANYGRLMEGRALSKADAARLAERLAAVKSQHANFDIPFPRTDPALHTSALADLALSALRELAPLYRLGAEPRYKLTGK